jgi:arylsulfatase A-like enzyme
MRWPGVIKPDQVINGQGSLQDFIPTFAAAAGEPDLVDKVKKGYKIGDKTYKVHLDGFNLTPFLKGTSKSRLVRASSTGATTVNSWPSGCMTGKSCSKSSAP